MAVSYWRGQESGSYSVHRGGGLSSPNLVLGAWNVLGELLVSSLLYKLGECAFL